MPVIMIALSLIFPLAHQEIMASAFIGAIAQCSGSLSTMKCAWGFAWRIDLRFGVSALFNDAKRNGVIQGCQLNYESAKELGPSTARFMCIRLLAGKANHHYFSTTAV
jgi:hypothetical protein